MSTHTPGPWRVNGSLITTGDGIALEIASVRPALTGNTPKSDGEYKANRRLIAAAPDLLAAAEHLADFFGNDGRMASAALYERLVPLLAAIKKARGEQ